MAGSSRIVSLNDYNTQLSTAIAKAQSTHPKASVEVEARFSLITPAGPQFVSAIVFTRFLQSLKDSKVPMTEETTVDYTDKSGVRRTMSGASESWSRKIRVYWIDHTPLAVRLSVSAEIPVYKPPVDFNASVIRTKKRSSFTVPYMRLDLTEVQMTEKNRESTRYEIELELLDITQLEKFLSSIPTFIKKIHSTEYLYSVDDLISLTTMLKTYLPVTDLYRFNRDVLVQARNIKRNDLVFGGLIGNSVTGYSVTHKADGIRKLLVFDDTGIWLIMPPYEYNRLSADVLKNLIGTIIDGEMIPEKSRLSVVAKPPDSKYWFIGFDCLMVQFNTEISQKPLNDRLTIVQQVATKTKSTLLTLNAKEFIFIRDANDLFAKLKPLFVRQKDQLLAYKTDGFMFTPTAVGYNSKSHLIPNDQRYLTNHPDIVKYKPPEEITIDFMISKKIDKSGKEIIKLFSSKRGQRDPVLFEGTLTIPCTTNMITQHHELTNSIPTGFIVEYGWNSQSHQLEPRRLRPDKAVANDIEVALQNWSDMFNPIYQSTLEGEDFVYFQGIVSRCLLDCLGSAIEGSSIIVFTTTEDMYIYQRVWSELASKNHDIWVVHSGQDVKLDVQHPKVRTIRVNNHWDDETTVAKLMSAGRITRVGWFSAGPLPDVNSALWNISSLSDTNWVILDLSKEVVVERFSSLGKKSWKMKNTTITLGETGIIAKEGKEKTSIPWLDFSSITIPSTLDVLDFWSLNYEQLVSEEELELGRWFVVMWIGEKPKIKTAKIEVEKSNNYPVHRAWLLVNESMQQYMQLSAPLTKSALEVFGGKDFVSGGWKKKYTLSNHTPALMKVEAPSRAPKRLHTVIPEPEPEPIVIKRPSLITPLPRAILKPLAPTAHVSLSSATINKYALSRSRVGWGLPILADDEVEVVPCDWYPKKKKEKGTVVRIGAFADGSCFIHSVLKGYNKLYQDNNESGFRRSYARDVRDLASESLGLVDPDDESGKTFYESAGGGTLAVLGSTYTGSGEAVEDFSLQAIKDLLSSNQYLGDEVYAYIGQLLHVNIYVVRSTRNNMYRHTEFIYEKNPGGVVISGDGTHYETIGIALEDSSIQTFFKPDDPFLKAIKKAPGFPKETNEVAESEVGDDGSGVPSQEIEELVENIEEY